VSASGGKKTHNFENFDILGAPVPTPFTDEGQIWCAIADPRSRITRKISSECVHCLGFRWPKTTFLDKLWHFWGSCANPFYRWEPNLVCRSRRTVYAYVPNFVSVGLFCRSLVAKKLEKPKFLPFFGLRHLVVSPVGSNLRKLNTVAQLQTFPNPTSSKSFRYPQRLHGEIGRTISDVQKRDRQTDREPDKKLYVFGHTGGVWNPSLIKLGMVIEDFWHVLAPLKLLGVWRIVSLIGGVENLGVTRPPQLKTPITP